jgi:hypothetical protein
MSKFLRLQLHDDLKILSSTFPLCIYTLCTLIFFKMGSLIIDTHFVNLQTLQFTTVIASQKEIFHAVCQTQAMSVGAICATGSQITRVILKITLVRGVRNGAFSSKGQRMVLHALRGVLWQLCVCVCV